MISTRIFPLTSLLMTAAIFGFFYAWVCSTMWGLDAADPAVAIKAMQAMNASVRNAVFFPAFFLTPVVLAITAGLLVRSGGRGAAIWFALAASVYLAGGLGVTVIVNVPMNEALALAAVPETAEAANQLWQAYSGRWQDWNQIRTAASGLSVVLTGFGLLKIT
ncbi:MAG: DUF1772 domain-containing protein [Hoeflea sp.]|nr:DUF1772 domain-containing protein [Hoeflea sp.]